MLDYLSFALGAAVAAPLVPWLAARITRRRQPPVEALAPEAPQPTNGPERVEVELARRLLDETTRDLETLASGLGEELATMASAIEGHAQLLCEGLGDPQVLAVRADRLWTGVRRLRMFSEKILSFGQVEALQLEPVDARSALDQIAQEIEETGSRLKVRVSSSGYLPPMLANERALRNAALFLVDTLLRIETRASRLELRAHAEVFEDQATRVRIEIWAEADESGAPHAPTDHAVHLGYIAARNLLEAQDARLAFDEVEGLSVACFLSFPTTQETTIFPEPAEEPRAAETPHHYGGVLILESDPEVRSLIAHELHALGRKMVSCVDGASARSLLEATPDRFELAVLSADARVEGGCSIAALAAERIENVRILLLTTRPIASADLPQGVDIRLLQKPFGLQELRDTIRLMAGSSTAHSP
jgi:CheY-like chemotaxis protein